MTFESKVKVTTIKTVLLILTSAPLFLIRVFILYTMIAYGV